MRNISRKFIEDFGLDPGKLGKLLSTDGLQHIVYEYGDDKVLKIPRKNLLNIVFNHKTMQQDYDLCKTTVPSMVVQTTFLKSTKESVATIQERIYDFQYLDNTNIRELDETQYKELKKIFSELRSKGYSLDLSGGYATIRNLLMLLSFWKKQRKYFLSNVVIDSHKNIRLLDFRLSPLTLKNVQKSLSKDDHMKLLKNLIYLVYGQIEVVWVQFLLWLILP